MTKRMTEMAWGRNGPIQSKWQVGSEFYMSSAFLPYHSEEGSELAYECLYGYHTGRVGLRPLYGVDLSRATGPWLMESGTRFRRKDEPAGSSVRDLDLSDIPFLHTRFARLSTESECFGFATQYGFLGIGLLGTEGEVPDQYAEPINMWLVEASSIRFASRVHEKLFEANRRKFIDEVVAVCDEESEKQYRLDPVKRALTGLPRLLGDRARQCRTNSQIDDYREELREMLFLYLNRKLAASVDIQMWPGDAQHYLAVRNLLGGVTLSLMKSLVGRDSRTPKICVECLMPILRPIRSDARFCGSSCRQLSYRRRRLARTERLRSEGDSQ